jgi:hypothetical protein
LITLKQECLNEGIMKVIVLHENSSDSRPLIERTKGAVRALKIRTKVEHVADKRQITKYGITHTPGLVINDKVVLQGRVPEMQKIQDILIHETRRAKSH